MPSNRKWQAVKVFYSYVDGVHFFTSPDVKGLCAANRELQSAFNAVGIQLSALVRDEAGNPVSFEPAVPVERFERWLAAHQPDPVAELKSWTTAQWAMKQEQMMMT